MIQDICYLFSKSITDKDAELIYDYINGLTKNQKERFNKLLKDFIEMKFKVTHNAIRLTLKIYNDIYRVKRGLKMTKLNDLLFTIKSDLESYLYSGNNLFLEKSKKGYTEYKKRNGKKIIEFLEGER